MKERDRIIFELAIKEWGVESQLDMATEECAELIVAICHIKRTAKQVIRSELKGELADVSLMIEQVRSMYGITDDEMEAERETRMHKMVHLLGVEL